ncbi:hypothetical protein L1987_07746 [Smallanthus sonchifolius]|uniref:Uncharacterized protein n=1 Tax=Smallanthus sonchifolius TaxID=185202 RepID=A0ACB9JKJ6_9ASTR|nr:hypothetical protein L1987_07746 [Smallanthus sonchifolius]
MGWGLFSFFRVCGGTGGTQHTLCTTKKRVERVIPADKSYGFRWGAFRVYNFEPCMVVGRCMRTSSGYTRDGETPMIGVRRRVGDVPIGLGLNPSEEGATEVGLPSLLHGGDTPMLDTEMEGGMEPPNLASPQGGEQQCKNKPKAVEEVVSDHPLESTPSPGLETPCGAFAATPEITKPRGPNVDEDGFTTVSRRKKIGPIKVQGRNQKPIKVKVVSQQNVHGQPSGRQAPAGPKGKQLGDRGGKNQQHLSTNSANCSKHINTDTSNPFSVLDIPKSIKFNKLIEAQDDLYPPDQSLKDGMDVDMLHSMNGQTEDSQPNPKSVGDHFRENDSMVCQLNREHIEGVRVLPASVISSPKLGGCLPTSSFLPGGKSYGISDDKKRAIADRLKSTGSISMDIADQWCPGQWDFFNDHCTLMGLDPDYCIEDVESDDENGTAQFFAAQMKVGMPKGSIIKDAEYYRLDKENQTLNVPSHAFMEGQSGSMQENPHTIDEDNATKGEEGDEEPLTEVLSKTWNEDEAPHMIEWIPVNPLMLDTNMEMNDVCLNKEYTGNSILDNLSIRGSSPISRNAEEEGEPEVTSDQSDKVKQFVSKNIGSEGNPLPLNFNASDIDAMDDSVSSWESLCQNPITIMWPGVWEMNSTSTDWEDIMVRVRKCWATESHMGAAETSSKPMLWGMDIDMDMQVNFFGEYNPLVECLAKWLGSHNLTDHEAWRKTSGSKIHPDTWLDVERGACQVEEATHRKKKKKRKVMGKNPFQNRFNPKTSKEDSTLAGSFKGEARRMIKVMRLKNKKIGKSMEVTNIEFSQNFSPVKVIAPPLGFGDFKAGKSGKKDTTGNSVPKKIKNIKTVGLAREITAKEANLEAIASSINETSENSALINSIRAMKNSKLTKFSAKMNENGVPRKVTERKDPCPENNVTQATKRNDLPMGTNVQGDGFTLVRRRRGGTKPMDQGMRYKPAFTNLPRVHNLYQNREGNRNRETGLNSKWHRDGNDDQNINNKGDQGSSAEIDEQNEEENDTTMNGAVTQNARPEARVTVANTNHNRTRSREQGPRTKMVETSNSFHLLDQEGNELEGMDNGNAIKKNGEHTPHDKKDGWVRKQERTLNAMFRDRLSQDQRFEAKRFVLDKLLPLDSTFSEWSPSLLEYFRHL